MIIPLYLAFIPIIHYICINIIRIRRINFIFPISYLIILTYTIVSSSGALRGYTLSTIPVLGDLHIPIILVMDNLSIVFLIFILIYYFYVVVNLHYPEEILMISIITLNTLSMDLLLSLILFLLILLYHALIIGNKEIISYSMIFTILFILGYIFTNTFNIGLLIFFNRFNQVPEEILGLGIYFYIISYLYILFLSSIFQPVIVKPVIDVRNRLLLMLYSLPILLRLLIVMGTLYNDSFYPMYSYSLFILANINTLYYVFKYISSYETKFIQHYEISSLFLLLSIVTPLSYKTILFITTLYITHNVLGEIFKTLDKYIILSRLGIFPLPGFLAKIYFFIALYSYFGIFSLIIPLICFLYMFFASIHLIPSSNIFNEKIISLSLILSLLLLVVIDFYSTTALSLFNLSNYQQIIFGV